MHWDEDIRPRKRKKSGKIAGQDTALWAVSEAREGSCLQGQRMWQRKEKRVSPVGATSTLAGRGETTREIGKGREGRKATSQASRQRQREAERSREADLSPSARLRMPLAMVSSRDFSRFCT